MKIIRQLLIIIVLLIPSFLVYEANISKAREMVTIHHPNMGDQNAIYDTVKTAFVDHKIPTEILNGWMPVGYLSLVGFYHKASVIWTMPDIYASYVYNGVLYGMLAALISVLLMYQVSIDQSPQSDRLKLALGCAAFWFALFWLSIILRFTWLPWSHYASAFVGISFVACFYQVLMRKKIAWLFLTAFFGCLFLYTRRHEAMAVFFASGVVGGLSFIIDLYNKKMSFRARSILIAVLVLALGVGAALLFISYFSEGMPFNSHYARLRELDSFINEYLKIYPETIPVRIIQTFFDPNFYSYGNAYQIHLIMRHSFSYDQFAMPMIFQLPILWFLLPLAFFTLGYALVKIKLWKQNIPPALVMFLLGFLSFSCLSCGYLSTAIWSGVHLKNGITREFILSVLLLGVGTGPALFLFISNQLKKERLMWLIPVGGVFLLAIAWGQLILPMQTEIVTFPAEHISLSQSKNSYHCENGICSIRINYVNEAGKTLVAPFDYVILNLNCPSGVKGNEDGITETGMTKRGQAFDFEVVNCAGPVTVAVTPLIEGYCGSGQAPQLSFTACASKQSSPKCTIGQA